MTLGDAIKRLRGAAGISQKDFATRLGISPSYLSQIEGDHREPTIPLIRRMAEELGLPAVILFAAALSAPTSLPQNQRQRLQNLLEQLVDAASMNIVQTSLSLNA